MLRRQTLVDFKKVIAQYIDGNKYAIELGANEFHTDGDDKPRWNGTPFMLGDTYELPIATDTVLGGMKKGARLSITIDGTLSADQKWDEMQGDAPGVSFFENDANYQDEDDVMQAIEEALEDYTTEDDVKGLIDEALEDYATEDEVVQLIEDAIDELEYVKNVEYDEDDHIITVTFKNDSVLNITVPTLDIIDDIDYDATTKEIVLIKKDGSELRIDVSDLVDVYTGTTGTNIQIVVNSDNEISAILLSNSITEAQLVEALRDKINGKIDKVEDADEDNIAVFTDDGQVKDSGVSIADIQETIDDAKTELQEAIDDLAEEFEEHEHNGTDSKQINYNNLTHKPVEQFLLEAASGQVVLDMESELYNVEYVISKTADPLVYQTGVVKVRYNSPIMEMDVFGDDLEIAFSTSGTDLIMNVGLEDVDIRLLVFYF